MNKILFISLLVLSLFLVSCSSSNKNYDAFASCLTEKGATMYGAFWCPHCQEQKKMFGSSFQYVNYVECSLPDGKTQTEFCNTKNIQGYPTWEFENGTRAEGAISLDDLSHKTGCPHPK